MDYEMKTFFSGEECLRNLEMRPDMIVLDHSFTSNGAGDMSGMETLMEIKKINRSLPVVILTAMEDENLKNEYLSKGAARFIQKNDYFIDTLMETIYQQLS
jgi:CheY-like chemotaxis protein